MNALTTEVAQPAVVADGGLQGIVPPPVRRTPTRTRVSHKALPSPRPAHAGAAPADQPVPRVPHNVACPVCRAAVGEHCRGARHNGGGPSRSHAERRVLAGEARRAAVYNHRAVTIVDPDEAKHPPGTPMVRDSLAGDPRFDRDGL